MVGCTAGAISDEPWPLVQWFATAQQVTDFLRQSGVVHNEAGVGSGRVEESSVSAGQSTAALNCASAMDSRASEVTVQVASMIEQTAGGDVASLVSTSSSALCSSSTPMLPAHILQLIDNGYFGPRRDSATDVEMTVYRRDAAATSAPTSTSQDDVSEAEPLPPLLPLCDAPLPRLRLLRPITETDSSRLCPLPSSRRPMEVPRSHALPPSTAAALPAALPDCDFDERKLEEHRQRAPHDSRVDRRIDALTDWYSARQSCDSGGGYGRSGEGDGGGGSGGGGRRRQKERERHLDGLSGGRGEKDWAKSMARTQWDEAGSEDELKEEPSRWAKRRKGV